MHDAGFEPTATQGRAGAQDVHASPSSTAQKPPEPRPRRPRRLGLLAVLLLTALVLAACAPGADGGLFGSPPTATTAAQDEGLSDEERLLAHINGVRVPGTVCSGIDRPARDAMTLDPRLSRVAQQRAELPPELVGDGLSAPFAVADGLHEAGYDALYVAAFVVGKGEAADTTALVRRLNQNQGCIYFTSVQSSQAALGSSADHWVVVLADEAEAGEGAGLLLDSFNRRRAEGLTCPHSGVHGPVRQLTIDPVLSAVAQAQAEAMLELWQESAEDADGQTALERIQATDYPLAELFGAMSGRFIDPFGVVSSVISSEEVVGLGSWCTVMMNHAAQHIGFGKAGSFVEVLFAAPR